MFMDAMKICFFVTVSKVLTGLFYICHIVLPYLLNTDWYNINNKVNFFNIGIPFHGISVFIEFYNNVRQLEDKESAKLKTDYVKKLLEQRKR